ncbi:MAG TPA: DUF4097 family beta strand repeat-containing protein, partial [Candidatus Limnocylindrales bacterium]
MAVSTNQVIEHAIGPTGDLVLKLVEGTVTLRGVDGDTARVAISAPGYDGRIGIERNPGGLQVRIPEKFFSVGWLGFDFHGLGSRTSVELDVDVPRGATVTIDGASTRVNGDGLVGEQRVHLVSGDLRLDRAGGRITVDGVSGRVAVRAARDVALAVRTVSGDISVTAPRIAELRVNTLSAGVDAAGALADDGRYRVETVSGRVTIATDSPLRVEARTMTGSVTSEHSAESRMDDGRRILS